MPSRNPYSPASAETPDDRSHARLGAAFFTTVTIATIGSLVLCSMATPFYAGLFFVPFSFGPLMVTAVFAFAFRATNAQTLLTISSVLYAAWFGYIYAQAFYINPDPQSPIAFLFVGVYALPVLVVFWLAAGVMQWRAAG